MAMEIEKNGEVFYRAAAEKSGDAEIKELFDDLAAQEQMHFLVFKEMLGGVGSAPALAGDEYDQYQAYLQVALDNALFAGPDKALAMARQAATQEEALVAAVNFEKDTLLFFYDLREMMSEADQKAVSGIINEEKTHLRRLARML